MLFALWTVQSTAGASCLSMKLVPHSSQVGITSSLPVGISGTIVSNKLTCHWRHFRACFESETGRNHEYRQPRNAVRLPRSTHRCRAIPSQGYPCVHVSPAALFVYVVEKQPEPAGE